MRLRFTSLALLALAPLVATSCSGGSDASSQLQIRCASGDAFCLVSCNLGCTALGNCTITEIAENQPLKLVFSQVVDAGSVNSSSFSIKTLAGEAPIGDYVVRGNEVSFEPRISTSASGSTFGFRRNETYVFTLAGGDTAAQGIRSSSGDLLREEITCNLAVTQGVIDLDQAPPRAELITPANGATGVPLDPIITIRFSELIDIIPFIGASSATSPVKYVLTAVSGELKENGCDLNPDTQIVIDGSPRTRVEMVDGTPVTAVDFTPAIQLPGLKRVQIQVTGEIRDLAGVPAEPHCFNFVTADVGLSDIEFQETFATSQNLDPITSSGTWQNGARPGPVGGDGRHGSFDATAGTPVGNSIWEWNTDTQVLPGSVTPTGQPITVTGGKFYFTDFVLAEIQTVRFVGTNPAQIFVRGTADIRGTIEMNGDEMGSFVSRDRFNAALLPGQPGGTPGAGGGQGGDGANRCGGSGPTIVSGVNTNDGQPGDDVRLPAGHAYLLRATDTGGKGSPLFPASGLNASVVYSVSFGAFCGMIGSGGAGGGFMVAGMPGQALFSPSPPPNAAELGPDSVPGIAFDPFPQPAGVSSLDHFLIGGSGGGGGGSHTFLAVVSAFPDTWRAGAGGSGGGGALAIRAGNDLGVSTTAVIESRGGEGFAFTDTSIGIPCPGGGGSGGSIVLQTGGSLSLDGSLDTSGGPGSSFGNIQPPTLNGGSEGGAGSHGNYRLEQLGSAPTVNSTALVPAFNAAIHAGQLTDTDDLVGQASIWISTRLVFAPTWLRYELVVDPTGNNNPSEFLFYSDDPSVSTMVANVPSGPVRIEFRGGQVSPTSGLPDPITVGPWRSFVGSSLGSGLSSNEHTGFRFQMIFNVSMFPNAVVRRLSIFYRA